MALYLGNGFVQQNGYRDLHLFQCRHSPRYVRVVFHGTLRKGCVPWNVTQDKFYVSQNFAKFKSFQFFLSHVQEKLQNCALRCTIKG
jgi:hypothetical protein